MDTNKKIIIICHLRKMAGYLYPKVCREAPNYTRQAKKSITAWPYATKLAKVLWERWPSHRTLIDMTACYGNESMACALYFPNVIACEWNPVHEKELRKMAKQFIRKYSTLNIQIESSNSVDVLEKAFLKEEKLLILCDPPWPGGEHYLQHSTIKLEQFTLGGKNVFDMVFSSDPKNCVWVIKVPKNFDISDLMEMRATKFPSREIQIWPILKKNKTLVFYYVFIFQRAELQQKS